MDRLGICLRTFNVWPQSEEDWNDLRGKILRFKVLTRDGFESALQQIPAECTICALVDGETEGGLSGIMQTAYWLRGLVDNRIQWCVVINEWDTFDDLTPESVVDYYYDVESVLKESSIKTVLGSVVSEHWKQSLQQAADYAQEQAIKIQYMSMHPYGKFGDDLATILMEAYSIADIPIVCDEYGVSVEQCGTEIEQAHRVMETYDVINGLSENICPFIAWFGYTDDIRSPGEGSYGLIADDGRHRPAYDVFVTYGEEMPESGYNNGSGIVDMMTADGTESAGDSEWPPFGERALGLNGVTYIWSNVASQGWRYFPRPV